MTTSRPQGDAILSPARLLRDGGAAFTLAPDSDARAEIAARLDLTALRKLRFEGRVEAAGRADWRLTAKLGATVVQPCVVTLEPVTTRIDETVERLFLASAPPDPEAAEVEMPEDVTEEPLGDGIDLAAVMIEALSLALPDFPRADGAEVGTAQFAEPGTDPLTDEDVKPFAGLKSLRDSLRGNDD